ncbi:AraC family transcriptional regulator [Leptospira ilyithenensis]|uniref:AraC family transcriptional regulator n=1 Tax=Leptospira ilyithenensis TaxID=2484901 RepID=UPI001AEF7A9F|nr:helix-turn-helix domain-containing protein [Leptospira ilyithenensis]
MAHRKLKIFNLEDMGASEDEDFSICIFENPSAENFKWTALNTHNFSTLVFVTKGEAKIEIDSRIYMISEQNLFYLPPYLSHQCEWNKITQGVSIKFQESFLFGSGKIGSFYKYPTFFRTKTPVILNIKDCSSIQNSFHFLKEEWNLGSKLEKAIIKNFTELILLFAGRCNILPFQELPTKVNRIVYDFISLLQGSQGEIRSVQYYASKLEVTPGHLNDTIKEVTGRSASDFIKENVTREARRLLEYTDARISDVASQLNFHDSAYFTRFFKKEIGITPSEFRQKQNPQIIQSNP